MEQAKRHRLNLRLDHAVLVCFFGVSTSALTQLAAISPARDASVLALWWVATAALAWLTADFVSGLVHYLADNFGDANTPIVGKRVIQPFREHHAEPERILEHDFAERNANNALAAAPLVAWVPFAHFDSNLGLALGYFSVNLAFWLVVTNEIHALAHRPRAGTFVGTLQRWGLILDPKLHHLHHSAGGSSRGHYCITSGIWDRFRMRLRRPRPSPPQPSPGSWTST